MDETSSGKDLLTRTEVAALLRCSAKQVDRLVREHMLAQPVRYSKRNLLWHRQWIDVYQESVRLGIFKGFPAGTTDDDDEDDT